MFEEVKAGTKAVAMEECCTGLFPIAGSTCFFNSTHDYPLKGTTANIYLGPSTPIINQDNIPQTHLQVNLMEALSQVCSLQNNNKTTK